MSTNEQAMSAIAAAERLGVGLAEACDRAGIDRANPYRWRKGTAPQAQTLRRFEAAVSRIASERGTAAPTDAAADIAQIREALDRLESKIGAGAA